MQIPAPGRDQLPAATSAHPVQPVRRPVQPPPTVPVVEVVQPQPEPVAPYVPPQIVVQPVIHITNQNTNTSSASAHAQASATAIAGGGGMGISRLGKYSLALAILGFAMAWVPKLGALVMLSSLLGMIFGLAGFVISLIGRRSGTGLPTVGMLLNFAAFVMAVVVNARAR